MVVRQSYPVSVYTDKENEKKVTGVVSADAPLMPLSDPSFTIEIIVKNDCVIVCIP